MSVSSHQQSIGITSYKPRYAKSHVEPPIRVVKRDGGDSDTPRQPRFEFVHRSEWPLFDLRRKQESHPLGKKAPPLVRFTSDAQDDPMETILGYPRDGTNVIAHIGTRCVLRPRGGDVGVPLTTQHMSGLVDVQSDGPAFRRWRKGMADAATGDEKVGLDKMKVMTDLARFIRQHDQGIGSHHAFLARIKWLDIVDYTGTGFIQRAVDAYSGLERRRLKDQEKLASNAAHVFLGLEKSEWSQLKLPRKRGRRLTSVIWVHPVDLLPARIGDAAESSNTCTVRVFDFLHDLYDLYRRAERAPGSEG